MDRSCLNYDGKSILLRRTANATTPARNVAMQMNISASYSEQGQAHKSHKTTLQNLEPARLSLLYIYQTIYAINPKS